MAVESLDRFRSVVLSVDMRVEDCSYSYDASTDKEFLNSLATYRHSYDVLGYW